jgi:hypothetical protein
MPATDKPRPQISQAVSPVTLSKINFLTGTFSQIPNTSARISIGGVRYDVVVDANGNATVRKANYESPIEDAKVSK